MQIHKMFYILGMTAIIGLLGLLLTFTFWAVYPYNVDNYITWNKPKNLILNKDHIIKSGEVIKWVVEIDVKREFTGNTTRFIVSDDDGCDYKILPTTTMIVKTGIKKYNNVSYVIPEGFKPCTYHVHLVTQLRVNPYRTIEFTRDTEDFRVVE